MAAALQISSPTYSKAFDALPPATQEAIMAKVDSMGTRLATFQHKRLVGRDEFKLRVGDYRVIYTFDVTAGQIFLHTVRHRREVYR